MPTNEAHEDIDYPADVEYCASCQQSDDVQKCAVIDCGVHLHTDCGQPCEACNRVVCDDHASTFEDSAFCPDCLPEVRGFMITDEDVEHLR